MQNNMQMQMGIHLRGYNCDGDKVEYNTQER